MSLSPEPLFAPFVSPKLTLPNRWVMAPMTRMRSPGGVPGQDVADYYRRRAENQAGLIITEGTVVDHPAANGYPNVPYFHGDASLAGWANVVKAVHGAGGRIFPQLWHVGSVRKAGLPPDPTVPGYSPSGLAATFKKEAGFELALRRPEFEIRIEAPESVYRGEEFEANISLQTEGARAFEGWQFRLDYPSGFSLLDSNPPPTIDTNGWPLDKLEGEGGRLTIRGKADLDEGSVFALAGRMAMPLFGKEHTLLKTEKLISLNSSPLSLDLKLSEPKEAVGRAEKLVYIISFRNNTDTPLKSVIVRASLTGEMFDYDSLASEAKFERKNNVLVWEPSRFNQVEELEPGESGEFNFSIGTKDDYSIQKLSDKNFSLQVRAEIESPTVPYHIAVSKTLNSKILETKVRGEIKAEARAYFRDAGSFIINQGPLPPKVGASTNFTIHWLLTNFTTDLTGVEVRARLEDGVTFTGKAKSNVQSLPEFDEKSGEVIWRPGNISATLGVLGEKPEAIFQVEAIPKSSRTGQYLPLIGETKVSARDEWSGLEITASAGSVDTRLPGDPTVKEGEGLVRP